MVNKLSSTGLNRKVVLDNKRSGSACPIALFSFTQGSRCINTLHGGAKPPIENEPDRHKNACHNYKAGFQPCVILKKEHYKDRT